MVKEWWADADSEDSLGFDFGKCTAPVFHIGSDVEENEEADSEHEEVGKHGGVISSELESEGNLPLTAGMGYNNGAGEEDLELSGASRFWAMSPSGSQSPCRPLSNPIRSRGCRGQSGGK